MRIARSAACLGRLFGRMPGVLPALHGVALCGLVAAAAWSPAAQAVVVVSSASNITVPNTTAGVYINVFSGVSNVAPASAPGWDLNPWGSPTSVQPLNFFNPAAPTGGVYVVSVAGQVASLSVGSTVGAASTYGSGVGSPTATTSPWILNATNYFGFRFNGDDGLLHYGYGTMIIGATTATRTVGSLFYESVAGASITVAAAAVPEPSSAALMGAGGLLAALALRRRRQAATA